MDLPVKSEREWICGYRIEFTDDGPPVAEVLHVGTQDECERMADLLPAVAYSGARPIKGAHLVVCEVPEQ